MRRNSPSAYMITFWTLVLVALSVLRFLAFWPCGPVEENPTEKFENLTEKSENMVPSPNPPYYAVAFVPNRTGGACARARWIPRIATAKYYNTAPIVDCA